MDGSSQQDSQQDSNQDSLQTSLQDSNQDSKRNRDVSSSGIIPLNRLRVPVPLNQAISILTKASHSRTKWAYIAKLVQKDMTSYAFTMTNGELDELMASMQELDSMVMQEAEYRDTKRKAAYAKRLKTKKFKDRAMSKRRQPWVRKGAKQYSEYKPMDYIK